MIVLQNHQQQLSGSKRIRAVSPLFIRVYALFLLDIAHLLHMID